METATDGQTPRNAQALAVLARTHGWTVNVTYAEGVKPSGKDAGQPLSSIAVRMHRPPARLAAVWVNGRFAFGLAPFETFTLAALRERVAA